MHIDTLLSSVKQLAKTKDGNKTLSVDSNWAQGGTLYGGISASLMYQAMREVVDSDKVLRSLNTNFIGPIASDSEFNITVEVLREGKNVTQVMGHLLQNNKVAVISQGSFDIARESKIHFLQSPATENGLPKKTGFHTLHTKGYT